MFAFRLDRDASTSLAVDSIAFHMLGSQIFLVRELEFESCAHTRSKGEEFVTSALKLVWMLQAFHETLLQKELVIENEEIVGKEE